MHLHLLIICLSPTHKNIIYSLVASHPEVKIGSYPFVDHPEFKTIITIQGESVEMVEDAVSGLVESVPRQSVLRVEEGKI